MKCLVRIISGIIFALVAIFHVLRLIYGWECVMGTYTVPMWISYCGAAVAALLAIGNFFPCVCKKGEACCK